MGMLASQITSQAFVYSNVYSGADKRKYQSSASLAFLWGIHRRPVNSPHKWSVMRSFDVLFGLHLNKRLSKQSRRRWFETPVCSLWLHCNDNIPLEIIDLCHRLSYYLPFILVPNANIDKAVHTDTQNCIKITKIFTWGLKRVEWPENNTWLFLTESLKITNKNFKFVIGIC